MKYTRPKSTDALGAIGNTPLVKLQNVVPENCADIYVKLEYYNPTGSKKDRMAYAMIQGAEERGDLKPGMKVVELTGGSTGAGLAFVCAVKGYEFHVVSSDAFSQEKLDMMKALGANLDLVESHGEGISFELLEKMRAKVAEILEDSNTYYTDQFKNTDIVRGFETLGEEVVNQLEKPIDVFCDASAFHSPDRNEIHSAPEKLFFVCVGCEKHKQRKVIG